MGLWEDIKKRTGIPDVNVIGAVENAVGINPDKLPTLPSVKVLTPKRGISVPIKNAGSGPINPDVPINDGVTQPIGGIDMNNPSPSVQVTPPNNNPNLQYPIDVSTNPVSSAPATSIIDRANQMRQARRSDIEQGILTGQRYLPSGSLGRVDQASTPEMIAAQNAAKSLYTDGFGAPAFQAARESRLRGLNRDTQSQQQSLKQTQARGGIGGALGASQLANLQRSQGQNRAQAEQDLLLQNVAQKTGALKDWQQMASKGEMYNLGQAAKEKLGQLGTGLAEGQMGVSERGGLTQTDIGKALSDAMAASSKSGGSKK